MSEDTISQWAVVELFGHKTIAGQITKETNLFPLLRIDVPETNGYPAYTVEYGPAAIFSITYVNEAVAHATSESLKVRPINVYSPDLVTRAEFEKAVDQYKQTIAKLRALPSGDRTFDDGFFEDLEDDDGLPIDVNTHDHRSAVIELLNADPRSAKAAELRLEIESMERRDPTLLAERINLFAAHGTPIGVMPTAERKPEGVMLT